MPAHQQGQTAMNLPTVKQPRSRFFAFDLGVRQPDRQNSPNQLPNHLRDTLHALPELVRGQHADNISLLRAPTHA